MFVKNYFALLFGIALTVVNAKGILKYMIQNIYNKAYKAYMIQNIFTIIHICYRIYIQKYIRSIIYMI